MIDHIYLPVSDLNRSSEFYKKMLEPLGIDMPYKFDRLLGFAINSDPGFWLKNGEVAKDLYVAFTAKSADAVRASYKAAIDAGATSNKVPSLRPEWRADYGPRRRSRWRLRSARGDRAFPAGLAHRPRRRLHCTTSHGGRETGPAGARTGLRAGHEHVRSRRHGFALSAGRGRKRSDAPLRGAR